MRIVAIDFETANRFNESACALGIAVYEDGEIKDSFEWYIRPFEQYNYFTNSMIHHIYKEDVMNCPEFDYYYPQLAEILKDSLIIAHNALFDMGVLNSLCDLYGLKRFNNKYMDTVRLSRLYYPELHNHKLNTIAQYLEIELNHHNGQSDAYACLMIVLNLIVRYELYDDDSFNVKFQKQMKINR